MKALSAAEGKACKKTGLSLVDEKCPRNTAAENRAKNPKTESLSECMRF